MAFRFSVQAPQHPHCTKSAQTRPGVLASFLSAMRAVVAPALLLCAAMLPLPAAAVPVTYELDLTSLIAAGTFAGKPFSKCVVLLTFEGDTSNVIPFSVPGSNGAVSGYLNLKGTATVQIFDEIGNSFQDTFLPSAGIFVSIDNTNGGVGFGSFGVPPGNPSFPGQVAYPSGMLVIPPSDAATYDLRSDITMPTGSAQSCVGFGVPNAPCGTPLALPMTSGDLILDLTQRSDAVFSAKTQPVTPFTKFRAAGELEPRHFDLRGRFSLGATSNGISPLSENVTLQVDSYSVTIPSGSFARDQRRGYRFNANIGGVRLRIRLQANSPADYGFEAEAEGKGLSHAHIARFHRVDDRG
jgi:hypothetical protein